MISYRVHITELLCMCNKVDIQSRAVGKGIKNSIQLHGSMYHLECTIIVVLVVIIIFISTAIILLYYLLLFSLLPSFW